MWVYPQTNLASLHTLSSACLSLCLFLVSSRAARRDKLQATIERGGCRRITGGGGGSFLEGAANMEDALSIMPLVLQQPERGDDIMDSEVWKALPNELQDRVLACVPVPLLLQFRLVCKRWRDVIFSPAFSKVRAEAPSCGPQFLVYECHSLESLAAYDPWLQKWHSCTPPSPFLSAHIKSVSADGGLLCVIICKNFPSGSASIVLCNPVTRTYRELPETTVGKKRAGEGHIWIPLLASLVVDQASNSYKVIAAGSNSCFHRSMDTCVCRTTEVYDSTTDKWEVAGNLPWVSDNGDYHSSAVCGENLYCVGFGEYDFYDDRFTDVMLVFNLKRLEWSRSPVPLPSLRGLHIFLFERKGALMLVQQDVKFYGGLPAVHMWRPSNKESREWEKVPTLKPRNGKMFEQLFDYDEGLRWVGQGDHLFFVSPKWKKQAAMYDISRNLWTITPSSRFLQGHCQSATLCPLPFDFSLQVPTADSISGQSWLKY